MQVPEIIGEDRVFFGDRREDDKRIWIQKPTFDCDWYWSFGYLGTSYEHYHLSGWRNKKRMFRTEKLNLVTEARNISMYDALKEDYALSITIKRRLWEFCDLTSTIYALREVAEIYYRGGSHYTGNPPCKELVKNQEEYERINSVLLPALLQEFQNLIEGK